MMKLQTNTKENTVQQPLILSPLNNHLLVELQREYAAVARQEDSETVRKGVVLKAEYTPLHLTAMVGYKISEDPKDDAKMMATYKYLVGKTVMWSEGADAGAIFTHDKKQYAFVPYYRLIGFEDTAAPEPTATITKKTQAEKKPDWQDL